MRWLVVTAAVASSLLLASSGAARSTHATFFPSAGVVVPGQSIGGITIGMTQAQVKAAWGPGYEVCGSPCGSLVTWIFEYPGQDAVLGAAVKFSTPAGTTTTVSSSSALAKTASTDALLASKAASALTVAEAKLKTAKTAEATAAKSTTTTHTKLAALKTAVTAAEVKVTRAKTAATKAAAVAKSAEQAAKSASTASTASTAGGVVAVFTLGSPVGWGIKGQIMMGDPVSNVYNVFGSPATDNCIGYSALTVRIGSSTTAFYSSSGVIYGFALTAPSQSPCQ